MSHTAEDKNVFEKLFSNCKEYVETRIDLALLNGQDRLGDIISSAISMLVVGLLAFMCFLFISLGAAFGIGKLMHNMAAGCFIVAGFYLLVGLIIWINKTKWVKTPVTNSLLSKININED